MMAPASQRWITEGYPHALIECEHTGFVPHGPLVPRLFLQEFESHTPLAQGGTRHGAAPLGLDTRRRTGAGRIARDDVGRARLARAPGSAARGRSRTAEDRAHRRAHGDALEPSRLRRHPDAPPPSLPQLPFPRPSLQGTPAAQPSSLLRCASRLHGATLRLAAGHSGNCRAARGATGVVAQRLFFLSAATTATGAPRRGVPPALAPRTWPT
jgi:hypothetical protein